MDRAFGAGWLTVCFNTSGDEDPFGTIVKWARVFAVLVLLILRLVVVVIKTVRFLVLTFFKQSTQGWAERKRSMTHFESSCALRLQLETGGACCDEVILENSKRYWERLAPWPRQLKQLNVA